MTDNSCNRLTLRQSVADDIRSQGWSVAVHNDYRQGGLFYTFWLFTKDGQCIRGEGRTDAEALNFIRSKISGLQSVKATSSFIKTQCTMCYGLKYVMETGHRKDCPECLGLGYVLGDNEKLDIAKYLSGGCTEENCTLCKTALSLRRPGMRHAGLTGIKGEGGGGD